MQRNELANDYCSDSATPRNTKRPLAASLVVATVFILSGCSPNFYSLPVFTTTNIHNEEALTLLSASGPETIGSAGPGLSVRDPFSDGHFVGVSASGGGMRAAAFTLGILAELDEMKSSGQSGSALDEVDLLSSVSGGSWAVASMLSTRAENDTRSLHEALPLIERQFAQMKDITVRKWARSFIPTVTAKRTFRDIYPSDKADPLPFAYFNASLYPSQSPFVFTPAYLEHYKVTSLGDPADPTRIELGSPATLADIPIGYAASASSAVPGFTSAFATTELCDGEDQASFCYGRSGSRNTLQILDGGLYDNIGYKTLVEVALTESERMSSVSASLIMIDSADVEAFQTIPADKREDGNVLDIAMASSFPNQNATFDRLRDPVLRSAGFDTRLHLNFLSASGFDPEKHGTLLNGLDELAYYAAHDVGCWSDTGSWHKGVNRLSKPASFGTPEDNLNRLVGKGKDCVSLNFARAGYLYKTTFKYDDYRFKLNYQLGRLVVRMKCPDLAGAVFPDGKDNADSYCKELASDHADTAAKPTLPGASERHRKA